MNNCNCATSLRIPDIETENGRWPMPDHIDSCPKHKKIRYVLVEFDGSFCVMSTIEAMDYKKDVNLYDDPDEYKYEDVFLTKDQYEKLPDFTGF